MQTNAYYNELIDVSKNVSVKIQSVSESIYDSSVDILVACRLKLNGWVASASYM
jgi:hypothetical protein